MKNILLAIVTSLLLFAASAGASLYLNQPPEPTDDMADKDEQPLPDETYPEPPIKKMADQMPVAIRPDQALTIDAVRQMSESAEKRQQMLNEFESQLKKEEQNVKLLFEDLKREKKELTTFSEGVEAKISAMDTMTVRLQELLAQIDSQKKVLDKLEKKTGVEVSTSNETQARVDQVKGWFTNLEPQSAADILIDKANQGDLEFAAAILHSMQDRQKTKILAAINDPTLVNQLIDSLEIVPKRKK